MFLLSKTQLRRVIAIGLISITLFFSSAWGLNSDRALAEVLKQDIVGISEDNVLNDAEYESAKISRNQEQAQRSKQAEEKAERKAEQESIAEKLNLDEIEETLDLD
ncbi:hypothetical protein I4641_05525 [Waterburya agarophytonicola K14]|uniref:Uncharacterized protein n=1 Tax=Waterburya agarophytonicola KI4 TaxID=2874699 RepID=A0A964BPF0_9CYAN|nr:hypothetical protein [Waterburya agarophytonicola]MCC0176437.1 hypothetical protein [Waterburya agarophytonicola KI4]